MLYTDHLSNLCLEWEPPVPSRDPTLPVCKEEEEEGDSGRIRWQCNARAGPMFTLTLLEVGDCKCHGELAFREVLMDGAGFGDSHVLHFLLERRGCIFILNSYSDCSMIPTSIEQESRFIIHKVNLVALAVCWLCLAI